MQYNDEKTRLEKDSIRVELIRRLKGIKNCVVLLPSIECLDIKEGLKQGKFTKDTLFVLFEHELDRAGKIVSFCQEQSLKYVVVVGMIEKCVGFEKERMTIISDRVFSSELIIPIRHEYGTQVLAYPMPDFMYYDFCGEYTKTIKKFLEANKKWFRKIPTAFTFSLGGRGRGEEKYSAKAFNPNIEYANFYHAACNHTSENWKNKRLYWTIAETFDAICGPYKGTTKNRLCNFVKGYKEVGYSAPMVTFLINFRKQGDKKGE